MRLLPRALPALSISQCRELGRRWRRTTRTPRARSLPFRHAVDYVWSRISIRLDPHHSGTEAASLEAEFLSYVFFLLLVSTTFFI